MNTLDETVTRVPPSGTLSFLFTDVEGSTRLWEDHPELMRGALARHDEILRGAIDDAGGYIFATGGDGFAAAFSTAENAVAAAIEAQRTLTAEPWPATLRVRVRMGIHTGVAEERDGDYFGPTLNRAARVMAAGHGGQVLLSGVTASVLGRSVDVIDLGWHHLKDLADAEHLHQVSADGLEREFRAVRSANVGRSSLPTPRTPLIGRGREIEQATSRLDEHRLVTLVGPGGAGKTRLAIEVAGRLAGSLDEGAEFADLASLTEDESVPGTLATAAGADLRESTTVIDALRESLGERTLLLLVDNCEHVIDVAAETIDEMLDACPGLRVLATSRELLRVEGEQAVAVGSLTGDKNTDEMSPAVALFLERWTTAPDTVHDELVGVLERLCGRLDGLPLAIEIAASRAATLPPTELLQNLDDRFALLTAGRRRTRGRQQTLETTVAWSYDLLDPAEQSALRRLSVPPGRFSLEFAAGLLELPTAATMTMLESLADRSLLVVEPGVRAERFRLLETIRVYANERLVDEDEDDAARELHAAVVGDAVWTGHGVGGAYSPGTLRLAADVRAAMDWCVAKDRRDLATPLLSTITVFHAMTGQYGPLEEVLGWMSSTTDPDELDVLGACRSSVDSWKLPVEELVSRLTERVENRDTGPLERGAGAAGLAAILCPLGADAFAPYLEALQEAADRHPGHGFESVAQWSEIGNALASRQDERAVQVAQSGRELTDETFTTTQIRWSTYAYLRRADELVDSPWSPFQRLPAEAYDLSMVGADGWVTTARAKQAACRATVGEVDAARRDIADAIAERPLPMNPGTESEVLLALAICCREAGEPDHAARLLREAMPTVRLPTTAIIAVRMLGDFEDVSDDEWEAWKLETLQTFRTVDNEDRAAVAHAKKLVDDELARVQG